MQHTLDAESAKCVLGLVAKEIRRQENRMADGKSGGDVAESRMEALERAVDALAAWKDGRGDVIDQEATDILASQAASVEAACGVSIEITPVRTAGYTIMFSNDVTIQGLTVEQAQSVLSLVVAMRHEPQPEGT